jgi:hypothetical protein
MRLRQVSIPALFALRSDKYAFEAYSYKGGLIILRGSADRCCQYQIESAFNISFFTFSIGTTINAMIAP